MIELILFGTFLVCLFLGVPISMSMGVSAFAAIVYTGGVKALAPTAGILYAGMTSETLLAIPFFILAGTIMELTGISRRLVEFADACFGHMKNGIALTAVLTALLFSSISGSGPATVAAIGGILIPALAKHGYTKRHSAALVATSGELGIILPPSIAYIVFAVVAADYAGSERVSIGRLFMAGVVPGLILVVVLYLIARFLPRETELAKANASAHLSHVMGTNTRAAKPTVTATGAVARTADNTGLITIDEVTPENADLGGGLSMRTKRAPASVVAKTFLKALPGLLVPVIILGGIYGGIFTPTESAAVAAVYALVVGLFVTRELSLTDMFKIFTTAGIMSGRIMLIIASATVFAYVITRNQIARHVADWMLSLTDSMVVLVLLINLALLIAGMFLDAISAFYLFIPLFLPVLLELGMDLTTIGVMMTLNLAIGLITPPVGIDLFVAASIAKIPFGEAVRGIGPFVLSGIAVLMLVTFVPAISNWLPDLLGL